MYIDLHVYVHILLHLITNFYTHPPLRIVFYRMQSLHSN